MKSNNAAHKKADVAHGKVSNEPVSLWPMHAHD